MSKRVSPQEAHDLLKKDGYVYVDVRSIPEFEAGHPEGAFNVPLNHMGPAGMAPNPEFLEVMQRAFPKDARLVIGCKAGGRSARAASLLESAGYTQIVDQRAGYEGAPNPATGQVEQGWRPAGLPVTRDAAPGRGYEELKAGHK
jgi:rhodanese-related sulfurtransferase